MTPEQAGICVATVQAYWPRFPIPDTTVRLWSHDLAAHGFDDVRAAIARLAATWPDDHHPSLAAILAKVREVRQVTASPALPSGDDVVEVDQAAIHALVAGFFADRPDDLLRARIGTGLGTAEERDRLSRERAARMLAEQDVEIRVDVTRITAWPGGRVPTPCVEAIGKAPVVRDGVPCCPSCGMPLDGPSSLPDESSGESGGKGSGGR